MTKMKSKKMTKSTFAIIIMAIAMVAMLAFGGTYAYFTASATKIQSTNLKTGKVALTTTATAATVFTASNLLPGDSFVATDVVYTVDTTDTVGNYVSVRVTIESGADGLVAAVMTEDFSIGGAWTKVSVSNGVATYYQLVQDEGTATLAKDGFKIPLAFGGNGTTDTDTNLMEADIAVTIEARSIQASHIGEDDAYSIEQAINALWGTVA